eukprot:CAMPEP_0176412966 /NCGR_PEP_ID=MMETSP0127-20121128/4432_1 /TAXON_ID=938130 /ORGANISM="Platyophrya macrostoma, Strain WH" /LENGTH=42 /DNA_ID= /DNA_START= /DNA_END= /DNA_ORIENTATION=
MHRRDRQVTRQHVKPGGPGSNGLPSYRYFAMPNTLKLWEALV